MGEIIVISSGKGGVGKTTACANIAAALAKRRNRVLITDADVGLRNLDVVLGLEDSVVYDIVDVALGVCPAQKAILEDKRRTGLFLLPAAQGKNKDALTPTQMRFALTRLKDDYDYILIDCPAGIGRGFENAASAAEKAIIVTTPELTALRDADRVAGLLDTLGLSDQRLVINRLRPELVRKGVMPGTKEILDMLSVDLLAAVPEDKRQTIASALGTLVVEDPYSKAGKAFREAAARLLTGAEPPAQKTKRRFFRKGQKNT